MPRRKPSDRNVSPSGVPCAIAGCGRVSQAKGLCHAHYVRQTKGLQLLGKIRKQRPRLTEREREEIRRGFQAGRPISHLATEYEIAKGAVQRLLRAAGLR